MFKIHLGRLVSLSKTLYSPSGCKAGLALDLVGNPKDMFSCDAAQISRFLNGKQTYERLNPLVSNENAPPFKHIYIFNSDINFRSCYFVLLSGIL